MAISDRYVVSGSQDEQVRIYDSQNDFRLLMTLSEATRGAMRL